MLSHFWVNYTNQFLIVLCESLLQSKQHWNFLLWGKLNFLLCPAGIYC